VSGALTETLKRFTSKDICSPTVPTPFLLIIEYSVGVNCSVSILCGTSGDGWGDAGGSAASSVPGTTSVILSLAKMTLKKTNRPC